MKVYENLIFLPDSPYGNWIIKRSEMVFPEKNNYICLSPKLKFIEDHRIKVAKYDSERFWEILGDLDRYTRIIIHYHNELTAHFLVKNEISQLKVIWVLWSGDLYNTPFFKTSLHLPLTLQVLPSTPLIQKCNREIREIKKVILGKPNRKIHRKSFRLIECIASPFEGDVQHAEQTFGKKFRHIFFAFLSVEELFDPELLNAPAPSGSRIMVGHTGSPENNHLDAFDWLAQIGVAHTIFCPLSYGNMAYIKRVKAEGERLFGERFECLEKFLPREEYYRQMKSVGFAVFNMKVQKGFGNILGLVYLGIKVFLNRENSIFGALRSWGIKVFEISEIQGKEAFTPLSSGEVAQNQERIKSLFNNENINKYYKDLLTG